LKSAGVSLGRAGYLGFGVVWASDVESIPVTATSAAKSVFIESPPKFGKDDTPGSGTPFGVIPDRELVGWTSCTISPHGEKVTRRGDSRAAVAS
jgi:hypothetical protein